LVKSGKGQHSLVVGGGVGNEALEGQHIRLWKEVYGAFLAQIGEELVVEATCVFGSWYDGEQRDTKVAPQGSYQVWSCRFRGRHLMDHPARANIFPQASVGRMVAK
jgi:hypothetical protein